MKRWDLLKKGDEYFFGATPANLDWYIFYRGNECHAAFCRDPHSQEWYVLFNGLFYPTITGQMKTTRLPGTLTVVEAKEKVEALCKP